MFVNQHLDKLRKESSIFIDNYLLTPFGKKENSKHTKQPFSLEKLFQWEKNLET